MSKMLNVKKFVTIIVYVVVVAPNGIFSTPHDCITPRNTSGTCVYIHQCSIILNIIKSNQLNSELKAHLQEYNCGYDSNSPKVCCEKDAGPCQAPDQNAGVCVPIARCTSFLGLLDRKPLLSDTTVEYLRQHECELGAQARVCCPVVVRRKEAVTERRRERLPQPGECGVEELQDKVLGGNATGISEYPWMALLEYGSYDAPKLACGGSLISERFVLTAAHCVTGPEVTRFGNLQRIRLGEYDLNNITDCINSNGYLDCSDLPQRIDVQRIISHEGFSLRNRNRDHDIALVQMKRAVKYTEFIRPICLTPPYFTLPEKYFVAGWGKTETVTQSHVKLKLKLPHFDHASCYKIYAGIRFPILLGRGQLCAGGVAGKDSCTGDSGGPLMASETNLRIGNVWYQVGVVSFGPTPCGQTQPGVYTNVMEYLPWIHKTVTTTEI